MTRPRMRGGVLVLSVIALVVATSPRNAPDAAVRWVAATRAGVARFADVESAVAAGYEPEPTNGPIVHYVNARDSFRLFDPRHPQALVYERTSTGSRLVAAMFMAHRVGEHVAVPDAMRRGWHSHASCWGAGGLGVPVPGGACPAGTALERTPNMVHVWLVDVPGGPFAVDMAAPFTCVLHRAPAASERGATWSRTTDLSIISAAL